MKRSGLSILTIIITALAMSGASNASQNTTHSSSQQLTASVYADTSVDWTAGKVVRVSLKRGVVTIAHEELSHLNMPSMTMGFKASDEIQLDALSPGDTIEFQAEQRDGKLYLVKLRKPMS